MNQEIAVAPTSGGLPQSPTFMGPKIGVSNEQFLDLADRQQGIIIHSKVFLSGHAYVLRVWGLLLFQQFKMLASPATLV